MSEFVRITDVTKVYEGGITGALNGGSLTVEKGEFTAIMGPSGKRQVDAPQSRGGARMAELGQRSRGRDREAGE